MKEKKIELEQLFIELQTVIDITDLADIDE